MSHDLRAPLRGILGFSHSVLQNFKADMNREAIEDIQKVIGAAQKMGALVDGPALSINLLNSGGTWEAYFAFVYTLG